MKKIIVYLFLAVPLVAAHAQNVVYDGTGKRHFFKSEDIDIKFNDGAQIGKTEESHKIAPALLPILPALLNIGFNLTQQALENNVKKFSAEYTKQKSNLRGVAGNLPDFTLTRTVTLNDGTDKDALIVDFKSASLDGRLVGFGYYYVDKIDLGYSAAKTTRKSATLDYTISIQVTVLYNGEFKLIQLAPIVVSSVDFEKPKKGITNHHSDLIAIPDDAVVTGVTLTMAESNPAKVRAERVLALWNNNKDDVKTIINNILPKEDDGGSKKTLAPDNTGNTTASAIKK